MVQGVLRLLADLGAHGVFSPLTGMLCLAGWAVQAAWAMVLWRLPVSGLSALGGTRYALLDCGAQSLVTFKMAEASQAISQAPVPDVASATSDAFKIKRPSCECVQEHRWFACFIQGAKAAAERRSAASEVWLKVVANALLEARGFGL
jgi:hypothetical protein